MPLQGFSVLLWQSLEQLRAALNIREQERDCPGGQLGHAGSIAATSRIGLVGLVPDGLATLERDGWRTHAFIEADRSTERHRAPSFAR